MTVEKRTAAAREIRPDDPSATAPSLPADSALDRYRRISRGLMASDAACVTIALLIGYYLRYDNRPMPPRESLTVVFAPLFWLAAFQAFGLYALQHLSPPEEFRRTFGAASVGIVLLVVTSYWSHSSFSRLWMGAT
jgi:FlaA1/EpsC-like NDP-sugar epimerase